MKPISLIIKGLNSFVEEQTVDFEKLGSQGIFGIFGPTGSGKSTVLDAITFALYGLIARETNKKKQIEYINANSDAARVVFQFEVNSGESRRYKVIRELKRKKSGGANTGECKIISVNDGVVLAEKEAETSEAIRNIIGLEYDDFVKTVVLPQGGFNDFLKMEGKDRREILERLFGLEKYGSDLEMRITENLKTVELNMSENEGALKSFGDINEDVLKKQEQLIKKLKSELLITEKYKKLYNLEFEEMKKVHELQIQLSELIKSLENEEAREAEIEEIVSQLDLARKGALLEPIIKNYLDLRARECEVQKELAKLEEDFGVISPAQKEAEIIFLRTEIEKNRKYPGLIKRQSSLVEAVNKWEKLAEHENGLNELIVEIADNERELRKDEEDKADLTAQKVSLEQDIEVKKAWLRENKVLQEERSRLSEALVLYEKRQDMSKRLQKLSSEMNELRDRLSALRKDTETLQSRHTTLVASREDISQKRELCLKSPYSDAAYFAERKAMILKKIEDSALRKLKFKEWEEISLELQKIKKSQEENEKNLNSTLKLYEEKRICHQHLVIKNSASAIRLILHEGDSCPVCSNIVKGLKPLSDGETGSEALIKQLQAELQDLELGKQGLLNEKAVLNERAVLLEKSKNDLGEALKDLSAEYDEEKLRAELMSEDDENKRVQSSIKQYDSSLKEITDEEVPLNNELSSKRAALSLAEEQLGKELEQAEALSGEIALLNDSFVSIYSEVGNPKDKLDELNLLQEKIDVTTNDLELIDKRKADVLSKIEVLDLSISNLKVNAATLEAKKQEHLGHIEDSRAALTALLGEAVNPEGEIEKNEDEIKELELRYESAKKCKEENDAKLHEISRDKDMVQHELKNLSDMSSGSLVELYKKIKELGVADFSAYSDSEKHAELLKLISFVLSSLLTEEALALKNKEVEAHRKFIISKKGEIDNVQKMIGERRVVESDYIEAEEKKYEADKKYDALLQELAGLEQRYSDNKLRLKQVRELLDEAAKINDRRAKLKELQNVLKGKKFVEFMALKQLDYITLEATQILSDITNGAYYLEVGDKGDFKIRDNKNGGAVRNVKSLSGGETFVVSLALALALSAQIQLKGKAPLELFFLDEGFGTLDDDLLEVVMDALERIQHDRLKIGIISHVELLKQRMPVKLMISPAKTGEGGSKVRIEYS